MFPKEKMYLYEQLNVYLIDKLGVNIRIERKLKHVHAQTKQFYRNLIKEF